VSAWQDLDVDNGPLGYPQIRDAEQLTCNARSAKPAKSKTIG
jgi:hypothetical protein